MKFAFSQRYTFPVDMASAIVTYLDCEHYIFLHATCETKYKIVNFSENKCTAECHYKSGIFKWHQIATTEYIAPATLKQYNVKIRGFGFALLANFFDVKTTLKYYYNDKNCEILDIETRKTIKLDTNNNILISDILYEIDLPFFFYPFKKILKNRLKKLKIEKDLEDLDFIKRRISLFGTDTINPTSGYWIPYFKKSYFLLFKEKFIDTFFPQLLK